MANNYVRGQKDTRPWGLGKFLTAVKLFVLKESKLPPVPSFRCNCTTTGPNTGSSSKAPLW